MSSLDPCLFYRIDKEEKNFVTIFLDDTIIFTNKEQNGWRSSFFSRGPFPVPLRQERIDDAAEAT